MQQLITVYGFWNDTKESFKRLCMVDSRMSPNHPDHHQFIDSLEDDPNDDAILYYYEPDEHITGNKGDFWVYKYSVEGIRA
jgi:hypothetical protein